MPAKTRVPARRRTLGEENYPLIVANRHPARVAEPLGKFVEDGDWWVEPPRDTSRCGERQQVVAEAALPKDEQVRR